MKTRLRQLLIATVLVTAFWTLFTWPLPRHVTSGISYAARLTDPPRVRHMVAGDHLQLMYHFWLAADIVRGQTPWMSNPYQFNTGIDAADRDISEYYFPFSLVFGVGDTLIGRAFGWNLTGWISLVMTFFFTWRLARRYSGGEWSAAAGALLSVILPYRWITLLGGSPTGFDMVLVPLLWLGLDLAIRDGRRLGGVMAGIALWCTAGSDPHVFFFSVLSVPAWALVALGAGLTTTTTGPNAAPTWPARAQAWARQGLRGLWPAAVLGVAPLLITLHRSAVLAETGVSDGWHPRDVARYSPVPHGLWSWAYEGIGDQIFLGIAMPLLILIGVVALCRRPGGLLRTPAARLLVAGLLLVGAVGIVLLALGTHGPRNGILMEYCRTLIPPYRMVRQTAKIYCLLPTLLAVLAAVGVAALAAGPHRRRAVAGVVLLLGLATFEYRAQLMAGVCLLDHKQAAYAVVATDAEAEGVTARALALPLWPGQSHWGSLNQHYASLYRIRMVNGYSPAVPKGFQEEVFQAFESANQGALSDRQLDALQAWGIHWIIFHEEAFPEQVSPFPSGIARARLLAHPRLDLRAQDAGAWTFRIRTATRPPAPIPDPPAAFYAPTRIWEFERLRGTPGVVEEDSTASAGARLRVVTGDVVRIEARGSVTPYPGQKILLRTRGPGVLKIEGDIVDSGQDHVLADAGWNWIHVSILSTGSLYQARLKLTAMEGTPLLDMALLTAGEWKPPAAGESLPLPPVLLFHEGVTALDTTDVLLDDARPAAMGALYGPRLPLEPGSYTLELVAQADIDTGTVLGFLRLDTPTGPVESAILAGAPTRLAFDWTQNWPMSLRVDDSRAADMTITTLTLHRHAQ